jgi:hypothetical protein
VIEVLEVTFVKREPQVVKPTERRLPRDFRPSGVRGPSLTVEETIEKGWRTSLQHGSRR